MHQYFFLQPFLACAWPLDVARVLLFALSAPMAAKACRQNAWLGMLLSDYDWAENGVLELARQIQSEYWCLKYFSLFIVIGSYLKSDVWLDRESLLAEGDEVTVEPEGSAAGNLEPATGSYFARVHLALAAAGEGSRYTVKKESSE